MLKPIVDRLVKSSLKIIEIERTTHDMTNVHCVSDMINSFTIFDSIENMHVWFEDKKEIISAKDICKDCFESSFFEQTKQFYQIKANEHIQESIIVYLKRVSTKKNNYLY